MHLAPTEHLTALLLLAGITFTTQAQTDCGLPHDINNNGSVDIEDFLSILGLFGDQDSDGDGLYDSQDNCFDLTSCNYMDSSTPACVYPDAIGECYGFCNSDLDGDGVCDDDCGGYLEYQGYDYQMVQIGGQCWFAENLRSENYENGEAIPEVTDNEAWSGLISGARCNYDNDASNAATYGRLYNWYAVEDPRGLCPSGWHVPTDEEWMVMVDLLGGEAVAGVQMKTTYGWNNGGNGTNTSGFSGLPGGYRRPDGLFSVSGIRGLWWTSSPMDLSYALWRRLSNGNDIVDGGGSMFIDGYSIRCIQDSEE